MEIDNDTFAKGGNANDLATTLNSERSQIFSMISKSLKVQRQRVPFLPYNSNLAS